MPVRSLSSAILRWPDRKRVIASARKWARKVRKKHPEILRIGIVGSCARGDWGVGSDLDIVIEVSESNEPFGHRLLNLDTSEIPVPTGVLVYTKGEMEKMRGEGHRFVLEAERNGIWIK